VGSPPGSPAGREGSALPWDHCDPAPALDCQGGQCVSVQ
jgi:hypothetical protein